MKNGRNASGQFLKGHSGFKPKGAVSKKSRRREQLLDQILAMLGNSLAESLHSMTPQQIMKLYLQLLKLTVPKLARVPYVPDLPENQPTKVQFEFVDTVPNISGNPADPAQNT